MKFEKTNSEINKIEVYKNRARNQTPSKSRSAAIKAGNSTYHGSSCRHGHDGIRHTKSQDCVTCTRAMYSYMEKGSKSTITRRAIEDRLEARRLSDEWGEV